MSLAADVDAVLALPRGEQPAAIRQLCARFPSDGEPWNSAFGPGSLYRAFTRTSVARGVHAANRAVLRPHLDARPNWRVIEVGGGAGALWEILLRPTDLGEIVVVDPHPEGAEGVRACAPAGVRVRHVRLPIQEAQLPPADAVVLSLVLHHVAGADADARAHAGMSGPGKLEALTTVRDAVRAKAGLVLLNEADVHCDLEIPPGRALLEERLTDSYVRRFSRSILHDLAARPDEDPDVRRRWEAIVRRWGLLQVPTATDSTYAERDVYELDVPRWLALLERAGLEVHANRFTDPWMLFHQYVAR